MAKRWGCPRFWTWCTAGVTWPVGKTGYLWSWKTGGFHSHGDPPIAGWFISWKIRRKYGGWLGLPPWLRKPSYAVDVTAIRESSLIYNACIGMMLWYLTCILIKKYIAIHLLLYYKNMSCGFLRATIHGTPSHHPFRIVHDINHPAFLGGRSPSPGFDFLLLMVDGRSQHLKTQLEVGPIGWG